MGISCSDCEQSTTQSAVDIAAPERSVYKCHILKMSIMYIQLDIRIT